MVQKTLINRWIVMCNGILLAVLLSACNHADNTAVQQPPRDVWGLTYLQQGHAATTSSGAEIWDFSNADARPVQPGQTLVLAELTGPGMIHHFWNTIDAVEYGASRNLVIRMYWDGEENPSVEVPLGDFFGVGHGMSVDFGSAMVSVTSEGMSRNCYWPMPFRESAKITVTNEGRLTVDSIYWAVDWTKLDSLPADTPYFHSQYRQEYPCNLEDGLRYVIADIKGKGHYVGTILNCRQHERGWMGEGDDFFFIDGEETPSMRGSALEDYFCDAWGFRESANMYHGVTVYEGYEIQDRTSVYRWHTTGPISFDESIRFEMEHWGWWWKHHEDGTIDHEINQNTIEAGTRSDDWSTVAFWYQLEPHAPFPKFPTMEERHYYDWSNLIEAESLKDHITVDRGSADVWGGIYCSGNSQIHWSVDQPHGRMTVPFDVAEEGDYELVMHLAREMFYGDFAFYLDGQKLGRNLDLYHPTLSQREYALPATHLTAGEHKLEIQNVGKNPRGTNYHLGLDALLLNPVKH